jgi:hypothetical protein
MHFPLRDMCPQDSCFPTYLFCALGWSVPLLVLLLSCVVLLLALRSVAGRVPSLVAFAPGASLRSSSCWTTCLIFSIFETLSEK